MVFSNVELAELAGLAEDAALLAGRFIQQCDRASLKAERKASGHSLASQVVTELDRISETMIQNHLNEFSQRYELAWLGEESADHEVTADFSRFTARAFWCVDPLDGTQAYLTGRDGYAVSVALVSQQGEALLGMVYDPVHDRLYRTYPQQAPASNSLALEESTDHHLHWYLDASMRASEYFPELQANLLKVAVNRGFDGLSLHEGAGAVMNACAVLSQTNSFYLKIPKSEQGGGCIWDYAATKALFVENNKPVSDAYGNDLPLNRSNHFFNDIGVLYASDHALHQAIMDACQSFLE